MRQQRRWDRLWVIASQATYAFKEGLKGYFSSTRSGDGNGGRWGLDILGYRGVVTTRPDGRSMIGLLRDPSWAPFGRDRKWEPLPGAPAEVESTNPRAARYGPIIDDLLLAIAENREPAVRLQDGLASLEMLQAVYDTCSGSGCAFLSRIAATRSANR